MLKREEFSHAYHPIVVEGQRWRAISWTTAASVASVVEMVADGQLPQKGFIKQEDIPLDSFLQTLNGTLFGAAHKTEVAPGKMPKPAKVIGKAFQAGAIRSNAAAICSAGISSG